MKGKFKFIFERKNRALLVLSILLVIYAAIPSNSIAQSNAYSARIGKDNAPHELVIYFSLGCSHCLTSFDMKMGAFQEYVNKGELRVELVEVPGLINGSYDKDAYDEARRNSVYVSNAFACVTEEAPERAMEFIRIFIKSVKVALHGSERNWGTWPYAKTEDLNPSADSPFFNAQAKNPQKELAKNFFLETEVSAQHCLSPKDEARLHEKVNAQSKRFLNTKADGVPLYILDGEVVPHSHIARTLYKNIRGKEIGTK